MISCREKLVTDGLTTVTNDSESIGPTSKVGGSKKRVAAYCTLFRGGLKGWGGSSKKIEQIL